jgi:hypothetical protein
MTTWTPAEITTVIGAVGAFITALASAWVSIRNSVKLDEQAKGVLEIKIATDGMKTALMEATAKSNLLQGQKEGVAYEQDRTKGVPLDVKVVNAEDTPVPVTTASPMSGTPSK